MVTVEQGRGLLRAAASFDRFTPIIERVACTLARAADRERDAAAAARMRLAARRWSDAVTLLRAGNQVAANIAADTTSPTSDGPSSTADSGGV